MSERGTEAPNRLVDEAKNFGTGVLLIGATAAAVLAVCAIGWGIDHIAHLGLALGVAGGLGFTWVLGWLWRHC